MDEDKIRKIVREEIRKSKQKQSKEDQVETVSRRDFLKKLGVGALGLGALSLPSVSAYEIRSSHGLDVWSEGSQHMEVYNGEIDFHDNNLTRVNQINGQDVDDLGVTDHSNLSNVNSDQHHPQFTASDARTAINNDSDHGSTAPHNYFSKSYDDLTDVPSSFPPQSHGNEDHTTNYSAQGHNHSGDTIQPSTISGSITNRSGGVTQIDANTYKDSTEPSNPVQGDQWIDTNNQEYKIYDSYNWVLVSDIPAIPDSVVYDFEGGDVSAFDFTGSGFKAVTDRAHTGQYSGYSNNGGNVAAETPDGFGDGVQISRFQFYWQETSDSAGGGIQLFNSAGNREIAVGSNNPQWLITDDNTGEFNNVYSGDGYDRFVYVDIQFDWSSTDCDIYMEDLQSGTSKTFTSRPLINGVDISSFQIDGFSSYWGNNSNFEMWFDDIEITT